MPSKRSKKPKRNYSKSSRYKGSKVPLGAKLLIGFLALTTLVGVGYIAYDILKTRSYSVGSKDLHLSTDLKKNVLTNKIDLESKDNLDEMLISNNNFITDGENVTLKVNKSTTYSNKLQENIKVKKVEKIVARIYAFSVKGDEIVMNYENITLEDDDLVNNIFKKLKEIKNTDRMLSFVNPKVKLIDYKVSGDTLILNLSKDIEYNEYGGEGILYSIYQIAFTLGSALKVDKVLILIEGREPKYLGGEGVMFQNPIDLSKSPKLYWN